MSVFPKSCNLQGRSSILVETVEEGSMRDELFGDLKMTMLTGHHQGCFLGVIKDVWIGSFEEEELDNIKVAIETGKVQG